MSIFAIEQFVLFNTENKAWFVLCKECPMISVIVMDGTESMKNNEQSELSMVTLEQFRDNPCSMVRKFCSFSINCNCLFPFKEKLRKVTF